jgi:hypothetical protein
LLITTWPYFRLSLLFYVLNAVTVIMVKVVAENYRLINILDYLIMFTFTTIGGVLGALMGATWLDDIEFGFVLGVGSIGLITYVAARGNPIGSYYSQKKR